MDSNVRKTEALISSLERYKNELDGIISTFFNSEMLDDTGKSIDMLEDKLNSISSELGTIIRDCEYKKNTLNNAPWN